MKAMTKYAARSIVISALLLSGCESESTIGPKWYPVLESLEATASKYPAQGIIIVFGSDSSKHSKQNQQELAKIADKLPYIVFIYADVSDENSAAAQILKEQGFAVPTNFLYGTDFKSWEVLPDVIDSSTLKEVFMSTSLSNRHIANHWLELKRKEDN